MTLKEGEWYDYPIYSGAFLDRAQLALKAFDETDDAQQLFLSALMLRLGIEARLFEYIEAELPTESRRRDIERISEYQATKLLERLTTLNPRADTEVVLAFRRVEGGDAFSMQYTPVTPELAAIHGKLGGLLHFNYFKKNRDWFVAVRPPGSGTPTLLRARDLVAEGILELQRATAGDLLNHPVFKRAVEQMVQDIGRDTDRAIE